VLASLSGNALTCRACDNKPAEMDDLAIAARSATLALSRLSSARNSNVVKMPAFEKTCATNHKHVKSHVLLDFNKENF